MCICKARQTGKTSVGQHSIPKWKATDTGAEKRIQVYFLNVRKETKGYRQNLTTLIPRLSLLRMHAQYDLLTCRNFLVILRTHMEEGGPGNEAKFDSIENLEGTIGVKLTSEIPLLLCSKHYVVL